MLGLMQGGFVGKMRPFQANTELFDPRSMAGLSLATGPEIVWVW